MKPKNRKNVRTNYPKCRTTKKSMFDTEKDASRAMFRVWSHDPKADIKDLHTYLCGDCHKYHFGHISYYHMSIKNTLINQETCNHVWEYKIHKMYCELCGKESEKVCV